ncbi:HNH endonuclease family protein [Gilvimarinus chinensis]|uniref:HNH endonuclease family protein n=1 Tax=Gilvimarinus chinensis TaxID=396005 RepID=UPI00037CFE9C|nr:HNH endonuclease family protein [Gilvimarinus chinensis]
MIRPTLAISLFLLSKSATAAEYDRSDWGVWSDFDNDCMNTRHEVLLIQAHGTAKLSPDGCYVSTGRWFDPYTGKVFNRSSELDVDHIVPLKWAYDHGGGNWTAKAKVSFGNDMENLIAVDDGTNQSKGAKGPDEWLPPNHQYRCQYLADWKHLIEKYKLKLRSAEFRIFNKQLTACGIGK